MGQNGVKIEEKIYSIQLRIGATQEDAKLEARDKESERIHRGISQGPDSDKTF